MNPLHIRTPHVSYILILYLYLCPDINIISLYITQTMFEKPGFKTKFSTASKNKAETQDMTFDIYYKPLPLFPEHVCDNHG